MTSFSAVTRRCTILMFVMMLSAGIAFGQQVTGTILGRVTDSTGAAVPDAAVQIQNPETGFSRTDQADSDGRYLESNLPLGTYTVTVQKQGFQTLVRSGIVLSVGSQVTVNAELAVGNIQQHVEVTGEAPQIETSNATVSGLVNPEQMRSLPLNGRNIESLALLSPGVLNNPYGSSTTPGTGSLGSGLKLSVDGGRRDAVLYLLDGTTVNDQQNGGPDSAAGVSLGVEGILEFRVLTHNYSAEYGRKAGAVMSEVTRSGTNQYHGSAYEFVRNNFWDPRTWNNIDANNNPIPLPEFRRNQFGAALGGPIFKDKLFFFVNYEGLRQRQGNTLTAFVPDLTFRQNAAPSIQPYLNLWPLPPAGAPDTPAGGTAIGGIATYVSSPPQATREDYSMMRLDYKITEKDNFYMRYVFDPATTLSPGALALYPTLGATTNHFVVLSESHVFSTSALNDFRFAFNRSVPNSSLQEPTGIAGVSPFVPGQPLGGLQLAAAGVGGSTASITSIPPGQTGCCFIGAQNIFQEADTYSKVIGAHSLKFGVDIERQQLNITSSTAAAGFYTFASPATLQSAQPNKFTVLLPNSTDSIVRGWRRTDFGVFAQDDWRVTNRLTLNLGLREEFFSSPQEVNGRVARLINVTDPTVTQTQPFNSRKFNFSPRIGVAWDPTGSGKTSVRAGAGIFYSFLDGRTWYFPAERNGLFSDSVTVSATAPAFVPFPNGVASAFSGGGVPTTYTLLPNPHEPTVIQYNLDIQRQIGHGVSLEVGYVGSTGYHMPWLIESDTRIPCAAISATCPAISTPSQPQFPTSGGARVNANFADIFTLQDSGRYNYNGLQVVVQKSLSAGLQFQASYSYGRTMSNSDEYTNGEITSVAPTQLNVFNPRQDWSRSAFDQKHRLVANTIYEIPGANHLSNGFAKRILGGWAINGIITATSGLPIDVLNGGAQSNNADSFTTDRPNITTGFTSIPTSGTSIGCATLPNSLPSGGPTAGTKLGTASLWFDPCAATIQAQGTFGNLERQAVVGPKLINTDAALVKNTVITERFKLELRAELFNLFNKAQLGLPIGSLYKTTGVAPSAALRASNAGQITTNILPNRELQIGAKLSF